ncbi:sulfotransferase family 2 domain-containing protein [Yoonia sp. SS1-5]|uniref:Sulfotransferase family 2 domain-containing protein n=1 Tax=Yoonia rhodophyticola TaxID=3137370 RepID=A0AAN0M823_9RHOB
MQAAILMRNVTRGIEKIPGVNLVQTARFDDISILMFPKVGTRSIRNALLTYHGLGPGRGRAWTHMHYHSRKAMRTRLNTPQTLVVLRDPLERIHSCWKQKVGRERDDKSFYFFQYYPLLKPDMDFLAFLQAIHRLPTFLYEKHFMPLNHYLSGMDDPSYSFARLDQLDTKLAEILNTTAPPQRANTTSPTAIPQDAKDYFFAHLQDRYRADIDLFEKSGGGPGR